MNKPTFYFNGITFQFVSFVNVKGHGLNSYILKARNGSLFSMLADEIKAGFKAGSISRV